MRLVAACWMPIVAAPVAFLPKPCPEEKGGVEPRPSLLQIARFSVVAVPGTALTPS